MKFKFGFASEDEWRDSIEINNIDELIALIKKYHYAIVIDEEFIEDYTYTIQIYDDFLE